MRIRRVRRSGQHVPPHHHLRNGSCHNRLDHCFMTGSLSVGMGVNVGKENTRNTDNRLDHSWYRDIRRRSGNGQEVIQLAHMGHEVDVRTTVEYCLFEKTNDDAEIISDKSCSNVIRYNTFRDTRCQLVLRAGSPRSRQLYTHDRQYL